MAKLTKIAVEELKIAAKESYSCSDACRKLNLKDSGGNLTRLKKLFEKNSIDISHWTGQLWSKGKTALDDERLREKSTEQIFVENSNASPFYVRSLILKKKLLEYKCSKDKCNNSGEWLGEPLNLQLDHINGNRKDHRLENLRWLCPNCHSQTDTFCGRNVNKGIKKVSDEQLLTAINETPNIRQALKKVGLDNGGNYARVKRLKGL